MGIIDSQIEIEIIFNMVGVITGLKHCWLGINNLDKLVLVMKNSQMIPNLGAQLGLNQLKNTLKLQTTW
jgi:hypothetical protein